MKQKGKWGRMLALCGLALVILCGLVVRLVQLQILQGPTLAKEAAKSSTRTYTEIASRGELFDRNGTPLVTNALGYTLQLDYFNWDKTAQNAVILELCALLDEKGIEHSDNLPLSAAAPYSYTYESAESTDAKRLQKFIAEHEDWGARPTAQELFAKLCTLYQTDETLTPAEKRTVVGFRYYLDSCQFSAYNTPVTVAEGVEIDTVARIAERGLALPGVTIQVSGTRAYQTTYAAHILGRVAAISAAEYAEKKDDGYGMTDSIGKDGMEQALESYLRGIDGSYAVEVSAETGKVINKYTVEEADPGDNCWLTIDLGLQAVTEDALAQTLADVKAKGELDKDGQGADVEGGCAVVISVKTGEILALANYPTFSLERYNEEFKVNNANELAPFLDRCIASAYSPGSTFKMCSALAALEEGTISPSTRITDKGIFTLYEQYQPRCWLFRQYGRTHGTINVSDAIKYSCNYFFYQVGSELGIEPLEKYATALGLGQLTGVELRGERRGNLACPESRAASGGTWYPADTLMAYIGQGDHQFTPIQLVNYVATIVNGGTRYRPHLLKTVMDNVNGTVLEDVAPEVLETLDFSDSTLEAIKKGMKGVVTEDGTASSYFRNFPIAVGGKTGSAQNIDRSAHGVFASFAPYDDPEIAVVVVGEYAGSGGSMAPVAIAVYNQYFELDQPETPVAP